MTVPSIGHAPFVLPAGTALHRVQRDRPWSGTVSIGPVRLPPTGLLAGRFDLAGHPSAAFALQPLTAVYETQARRDAVAVSMRVLAQRELLSVVTTADLTLADLRPHTAPWPLLIAARYGPTQSLAADAFSRHHDGVLSLSAQEHLGECLALFDVAITKLRLSSRKPLNQSGRLHRLVAQALVGTMLPLIP